MRIYEIEIITMEQAPNAQDGGDAPALAIIKFHVGAEGVADAFACATIKLNELFDESKYEITRIEELYGINILNWGEGSVLDDLPVLGAKEMNEEDVITIKCNHCLEDFSAVMSGWHQTKCPHCHELIYFDRLIAMPDGTYCVLTIGHEEDES